MKLGEFIKNFSHNNMIRLHYKIKEGQELILKDWNDVSMDHEVLRGKGKNRHYIDNEVLGLVGVDFSASKGMHYGEAINIVIEKLENQPFVKEILESNNNCDTNV